MTWHTLAVTAIVVAGLYFAALGILLAYMIGTYRAEQAGRL